MLPSEQTLILEHPELLDKEWIGLAEELLEEAYRVASLEQPEWVRARYEVHEDIYEEFRETKFRVDDAVVLAFGAGFIQVVLLEYIGQSIMHRLRNDLYRHLLCLDLAFFHAHPAGRLVTRLTNDIQNMHEMFTSVMVTLFNDAFKIAGILVILYLFNVRLALIMTVFLPLSLAVTLIFSKLARDRFRAIRSQLAVLNTFLQETVSAVIVLQLFGRQLESLGKFKDLNQEYLQRTLRQIRLFGTFMPMTEFLSALAMATILWYGGGEVA